MRMLKVRVLPLEPFFFQKLSRRLLIYFSKIKPPQTPSNRRPKTRFFVNVKTILPHLLLALCLVAAIAHAQSGDKPGEKQESRVPKEKIPANPPLAPADALKTFKLPPGFRIETVASEPLIETPIAMQWDADGRIWIVEMPTYMPNPAATGEMEPTNRISILEDTDGDGKMDKKTVFLDGLVMPRALCLAYGGVLVCEPPALWWYPIEAGFKPGKRVLVDKNFAPAGLKNPEHTGNSPTWFLNNWIISANHTYRYQRVDGEWKRQPTTFRGQWGMTMDDWGRPFYNSNSDQLRTDLVPSEYYFRNPFFRSTAGLNQQPLKDQTVWPGRVNPGVNRGYQSGTLKPDGTLNKYTATCGPAIYRGDKFPAEFRGNAFIPEPSANMVRRMVLTEKSGEISGVNPYKEAEFLTSTDELFRPINAYTGPDGCLYLVDMYHGILQHRVFLTSYLRKQAEDRGLDKVTRRGRIYRIVHQSAAPGAKPQFASAAPADLVNILAHPNGWWRDTAQRLLVEKSAPSAIAPLKTMSLQHANPIARLHALSTLDGMNQLDAGTLAQALEKETDTKIHATVIRLSETAFKTDKEKLLPKLTALATSKDVSIQSQLAFTLGEAKDPAAESAMITLARNAGSNILVRDALISGLALREADILDRVFVDPSWKEKFVGGDAFIGALGKSIFQQAKATNVNRLLEKITTKTTPQWQTLAVLASLNVSNTPASKGQPAPRIKLVKLPAAPPALAALEKSTDKTIQAAAKKLDQLLVWPGKPGVVFPVIRPLTDAEQKLFATGKAGYEATCAACHQLHGYGQDGMAPPLNDSEWVAGSTEKLARILLHGVGGPITVQGRKWDMDMPGHGTFDDETIAGVLTYIRREWEHPYDPVTPDFVKKIRAATAGRESAWTNEELSKLK
ncbi:MAG: c-type cytochrome [Pedosphaera sp.]|nr:c-type cytochrome [Pedosphaera sp.]MST00080.1 c-type cytochrome [Pedosphaera sp.]